MVGPSWPGGSRPPLRANASFLTLIACLTWLSNVVQFVKCMSGSQPLAPGELHPARKLRREALRPCASLRHPLILDGFSSAFTPFGAPANKCLHVLSSFQRTGIRLLDRVEHSLQVFLLRGNLPILLEDSDPCQSHTALFSHPNAQHPGGEREAADYG